MKWRVVALVAVLIAGAIGGYALLRPKDAGADVLFQDPSSSGPNPFSDTTAVSSKTLDMNYPLFVDSAKNDGEPHPTPFGGSGSNTVCKPDLMIKYLKAHPDRLAVWAGVLGIKPADVEKFIHSLAPAILKVDVRVTNHGFKDGHATSFQAILPAGTAVLVTKKGEIVSRCRCGNPLTAPSHLDRAGCTGCPPHYKFPPPCEQRCSQYPCFGRQCVDIPHNCWDDPRACVPPCPTDDKDCAPVCPPGQDCDPPPCLSQGTPSDDTTWAFLKSWTALFADLYSAAQVADPCKDDSVPGTPALVEHTPEPTTAAPGIIPTATPEPTPEPTPEKTATPTLAPTPVPTENCTKC